MDAGPPPPIQSDDSSTSRFREHSRLDFVLADRSETGAGGVVFRRVDAGVEVALGEQRDRLTGAHNVRLPKGKSDPGETAEQTALREVREETGFTARIVAPLGEVAYVYREGDLRVDKTVHFFLMEWDGKGGGATDGELERIFWCPIAEAAERLRFDTERRAIDWARARLGA